MPRMVIRSRPRRGRRAARRAISVPRCREERAARRVRRPRKPSAEKLFLLLPAIAVRVALLAGAGLLGFAMRRLHLLAALLAALGVLRFRAIETLAFARVGLRSLGIKGSTGRKQAGTEEGDRQFHKRVHSRRYP